MQITLLLLAVTFIGIDCHTYKHHSHLRYKHKKKTHHKASPKYETYWEIQVPAQELAAQKQKNEKAQSIFEGAPQGRDESDNDQEGELYIRSAQHESFQLVKTYINKYSLYYGQPGHGYRGIEEALELSTLQQEQVGQTEPNNIRAAGQKIQAFCFRIDTVQEWVVCAELLQEATQWRHLILMHLIKNIITSDPNGRMLRQIKPDCSSDSIPFDYNSQYLWGCQCSGEYQSPIDISHSQVSAGSPRLSGHYSPSEVSVHSTHSQQSLKGVFGTLRFRENFSATGIRVKFPSEHSIDGHHQAAELQIVHANPMGDAVILSVLLTHSDSAPEADHLINQLYFDLWPQFHSQDADTCLEGVHVDIGGLLAITGGSYYAYKGSDSQPPCQEGLEWVIMKQPVKVSSLVLSALQQKVLGPHSTNSRSIQASTNIKQIILHEEQQCAPLPIQEPQNMQYVSVESTRHVYGIVHPDTKLGIPEDKPTILRKGRHPLSMQVLDQKQMERENPQIMRSLMHRMGSQEARVTQMQRLGLAK